MGRKKNLDFKMRRVYLLKLTFIYIFMEIKKLII